VVTVLNRDQMTKTINGVKFTFVVVERLYTSEVKLNSCTKKNSFKVIEVESCVASYGKDSYNFGEDEVTVNHTDNLTGGNESDGYEVYNYADKVVYTVNGNVKNLTPTGTIKVKVEPKFDFASCGRVNWVRQTTTLNEAGNGYVYVLSIRFESGKVLAGLLEEKSSKITWLHNNMEYIEGTSSVNSVVYVNGGWQHCTAKDVYTKGFMKWSCNGEEVKRLTFNEAQAMNWDNGYTREDSGISHLTVHTNRFKCNVDNGTLSVKDTQTGRYLQIYNK